MFSFVDLLANKYRYNSVLAHIASLLLLCMIPHEFFYLPFNYLFFLIGVVFMDKHIPQIPGRYIIVGCIITVFAGYFFPTKWTFYSINMYIFDDILFKPFFLLFRWIIYVTATFSAFELMRRFYKHYPTSKLSCAFSKLGNKTLLIYGFHLFIVADVYGYFVKQHYAPQGLLPGHPWIRYYVMASILTILTVLLCVWLNKWIHKSQILAQFILGENIHV